MVSSAPLPRLLYGLCFRYVIWHRGTTSGIRAQHISPEEIGTEYLDNLVSKSFIQTCNRGGIPRFVLHELLHDLAESVSEGWNGKEIIISRARHIYVHVRNLGLLKSYNLRNLRTLIIDGVVDYDDILKEVLIGLESIRVLSVQHVSGQLLWGSIGHLIHLRYLCVSGSYPRYSKSARYQSHSQCRPYHLQWLIYVDNNGVVLPSAMNCLVSLRHLGREIMYGIGKLTHLQELKSFKVGKKEGQKLSELKRLNELGRTFKLLSIENASTKEEAFEANLNLKIRIRELILSCSHSRGRLSPQEAEEVFEGLRPPPYIKKLTLDGYNGVNSPSWMVTENNCLCYLQYLNLYNCSSWKVLPTLGELPLLKHLKIHKAHSLEDIGNSFYGSGVARAFPCLDTLEFNDMQRLVVWPEMEMKDRSPWAEYNCPAFPRLRELIVTACPRLERVPIQRMTPLVKLHIESCIRIQSVPLLPPTLKWLKISSLRMLTAFSMEQAENLSGLTSLINISISYYPMLRSLPIMPASLQELSIKNCDRIKSVPLLPPTLKWLKISSLRMLTAFSMEQEENLSDLTSLINVSILLCPKLRSLPIMPASLQELSIEKCDRIQSVPLLPTTLKQLHISNLHMLTAFSMEQEENLSDLTSVINISISYCPKLRSLPIMPASLQELSIEYCDRIKSVPLLPTTLKQLHILGLDMLTAFSMEQEENLSDLTSLREVYIYNCPNLGSLPIMPASLQKLRTRDCPELRRERYQEGGDDWHKISHVPTIDWH